MLYEEAKWIGQQLETILPKISYPVLNIGSSTKEYRQIRQPYNQEFIFDHFNDEANQVIHIDMKEAEGVDMVGNLLDANFREKLKSLKSPLIFFNGILLHLDKKTREEMAKILYDILPSGGYLIVSSSLIFPAVHDPVDSFYREKATKMHKNLFPMFNCIAAEDVKGKPSLWTYIKLTPRRILSLGKFMLTKWYKWTEWKFMLHYLIFNIRKPFSAACLVLQKP